MPFKSKSQMRWAFSPAGQKALGGKQKVIEWAYKTKGKKLPEKVKKKEEK